MLPSAFISHVSSGRIRLHIPEKKYDRDYFSHIQQKLKQRNYIDRVEIKILTTSILIEHRSDLKSVLEDARNLGLFHGKKASSTPPVAELMQSPWLVKGLLALGAVQILRGAALAPGSTLLMDAYRLWLASRFR